MRRVESPSTLTSTRDGPDAVACRCAVTIGGDGATPSTLPAQAAVGAGRLWDSLFFRLVYSSWRRLRARGRFFLFFFAWHSRVLPAGL